MVKRKEQDTDKRQRQLCLLERSCIDLLPKHQQLNPADSNTMNRDDSVFSGVSQTQEDKYHMASLTWGVLMQKLGADSGHQRPGQVFSCMVGCLSSTIM